MIRLDADYFPFIIIGAAFLQFGICLAVKKRRIVCWIPSVIFLVLAGYGFIADWALFPYPGFFMADFMLSNALAGCLAFGSAFLGTMLGGVLSIIIRKYTRR